MCDCYKPDMTPIKNNSRVRCAEAMKKVESLVPWFGIEQEYTLFEADGVTPFGWPKGGFPGAQGMSKGSARKKGDREGRREGLL